MWQNLYEYPRFDGLMVGIDILVMYGKTRGPRRAIAARVLMLCMLDVCWLPVLSRDWLHYTSLWWQLWPNRNSCYCDLSWKRLLVCPCLSMQRGPQSLLSSLRLEKPCNCIEIWQVRLIIRCLTFIAWSVYQIWLVVGNYWFFWISIRTPYKNSLHLSRYLIKLPK